MVRGLLGACTLGLFCATAGLAGAAGTTGDPDASKETRREVDDQTGFIGLYDTAPLSSMPREPMWSLNCFSAERDRERHPEENHAGVRGQWRGAEGLNWFMSEIRKGYELGARSFFINRPMGTDGMSQVPASGWLSIPAPKRMEMQRQINDAILDEFEEPIKIYYFIGSWMTDPRLIEGSSEANLPRMYKMGENNFRSEHSTRVTLGGLMSAGAAGFGIDASASMRSREHYLQMAEQLRRPPFNLHVIGEALPTIPNDNGIGVKRDSLGDFRVDEDAIKRSAYVAIEQYMTYRWKHRYWDPETTRIFKWYAFPSLYRGKSLAEQREMIRWDHEHGYIIITEDEFLFSEALKLYKQTEQATEANDDRYRFSLVD